MYALPSDWTVLDGHYLKHEPCGRAIAHPIDPVLEQNRVLSLRVHHLDSCRAVH